MKTLNLKSIWTVLITVIMSITFANAQEKTCTVIDVAGGGYYDRLWIFSEPGTSDGFDNGWDGYKFLKATSVSPQIYFQGPDDVFQVSTTANVNNCKIGFIPGTATEYTMSFKHTALALTYQQLFLVDHIANTITDIYPAGVTYTFTAAKGDLAERFSLITFKETNNQKQASAAAKKAAAEAC